MHTKELTDLCVCDELFEKSGTDTLLVIWLRLHACIIKQPKRRTTTFGFRSFSLAGAKVWNELPTYCKETTDLNDIESYRIPGMDQIL